MMSLSLFMLCLIALVGFVVICGTVVLVASVLRGERSSERRGSDAEETRLIQELNQNLNRLEQRIESIETILTDANSTKETKQP